MIYYINQKLTLIEFYTLEKSLLVTCHKFEFHITLLNEQMKQLSIDLGISRIVKSKHWMKIFLWSTFLLISAVYCSILIAENVLEFFTYPVTTKIRYVHEDAALFPVIAFCNTNMFTTKFGIKFLKDLIVENFGNSSQNDSIVENEIDFLHSMFSQYSYEIQTGVKFGQNESTLKRLGLTLEEMLVNCRFQDKACDMNDFNWFFNWDYGNCFMFDTKKKIFSKGIDGSLQFEFFIGFEKLVPAISYSTGLQLMILNRSENEHYNYFYRSYSVKPNTDATFVVQRNFVNKLPRPYSGCTVDLRSNTIDSVDSDLYRSFFRRNLTYKQFYCFHTAYRINTYLKCNCVLEIDDVPGVTNICTTDAEVECDRISFYEDFIKHDFYGRFNDDCPLECNTAYFDILQRTQKFPSTNYARRLMKTHPYFNRTRQMENITIKDLKESTMRVNIYYSDIGYSNLEEIAKFTVNNLIGNIGGMLALFLGISLLSFVEIIEIVVILALKNKKE